MFITHNQLHDSSSGEEDNEEDEKEGGTGNGSGAFDGFSNLEAWLPDGYSQIFRSYVFGPLGFWISMGIDPFWSDFLTRVRIMVDKRVGRVRRVRLYSLFSIGRECNLTKKFL